MSTLFVVILRTGDAAQAPAADVAHAFSMTFTAAAGLALVILGLAIYSHAGRVREASTPAEQA